MAISFSGKLLPTAYQNLIQLQRFENDQQKLLDLPLNEIIASKEITYPLFDGDKIFVNSISEELRGYIEIEGAINVPGKYQIKYSMYYIKYNTLNIRNNTFSKHRLKRCAPEFPSNSSRNRLLTH